MVKITPADFDQWALYIRRICGIHLEAQKAYLIESRLSSLMRETGSRSFNELYTRVLSDSSGGLEKRVIDLVTTGETFFFRDQAPFELLKYKILPDLLDRKLARAMGYRPVPVRIWSAACATGQEVYSIAITVRELLSDSDLADCDITILGTDISASAVARASRGLYTKFEIERGLGKERLYRHFSKSGGSWKIKDDIRSMVSFRWVNLMRPLSGMGRFDIIFCRNVAIYFHPSTRAELFSRIWHVLDPHGYLILGSTESLIGIAGFSEPKRYLKSVFYQPKKRALVDNYEGEKKTYSGRR